LRVKRKLWLKHDRSAWLLVPAAASLPLLALLLPHGDRRAGTTPGLTS
jgi:drug/metabolite transporter superfamily protein YnfA